MLGQTAHLFVALNSRFRAGSSFALMLGSREAGCGLYRQPEVLDHLATASLDEHISSSQRCLSRAS